MVASIARTASAESGNWRGAVTEQEVIAVLSSNDGDTSYMFTVADLDPPDAAEALTFVWNPLGELPADAYILGYRFTVRARGHNFQTDTPQAIANALVLSIDGFTGTTTAGVQATYSNISRTVTLPSPLPRPQTAVSIVGRFTRGPVFNNTPGGMLQVTYAVAELRYTRPPRAPTIISPEHEDTVGTGTPIIEGTHNSPTNDGLGRVQIEVRQVSNNALMWNTTFSASGFTWSRTYAGQSLTPGTAYMVRARTRNGNLDVWGPWSDWVHFVPHFNRPPVVNTSSPKGGAIVSTARPSLTWTYSDADGDPQSAYQIQVRIAGGSVIWDTGQVVIGATTRSRTYNGPALTEDQSYEWRIRCWDSQGNVSEYTDWAQFTYSRLPQPPTLDIDPLIDTLTPTITGTYNKGPADDEAGYYYEIRQGGVVIYQSGFVSGAIATGQAYGTSNPLESPSPAPALQWGTTYQIRARSRDIQGKESSWTGWITFRTQAPPTTPTNLAPRDSITGNTTPRLSWRHNDPDGDPQTAVEIELREAATDAVVGDYGPLYIEQSEQFHDLLETLTDNPATQYKWRVRTMATPGAGWSPWSDWAFFTVTVAPELTVISPEEGEVLTTPALVVSWQMTGGSGTQQSARVRIYADDEVTLVYDSGVIVGTTDSHAVPVTVLKNEQRYYVRVEVTDTLNLTAQSSLIAISTLWAPPPVIEGVTIQAIGDQAGGIPYTADETFNPLPNLYLTWEPSNEPIATFLRYVIRRRRVGDTDWLVLATITMQDVAFYNDYEVASDTPYEYVVTQVVDVVGEEVESEFHEPAQGQVTIRSLFVHPLDAPTEYVELLVQAQSPSIQQPRTYVQPWGARAPVAHVGAALYATIDVNVSDEWSPRVWKALIHLLERQANGSVLMIRQHRDIAHYVQMEGPSRSDRSTLMNVRLRFTEVDHTPGVGGS